MRQTTRTQVAKDGTLTLGELRQFVASLDGAPGDAVVRGTVRVGGGLKGVSVALDEEDA